MVRRRTLALMALMAGTALLPLAPLKSQEAIPFSLMRATNVARMRAEKINGGLGVYRPAACMYDRGGGSCLIASNEQGFTFRFLGGSPGWQQLEQPASVETEIAISSDGREVLEVVYNGAPRPAEQAAPAQESGSSPEAR